MKKSTSKAISRHSDCPDCGAKLVIRRNKAGLFSGCSQYPKCNYIRPLGNQNDGHIIKILEGSSCPDCHGELALRQGKFGMYICCMAWPECNYSASIDSPDETNIACPLCHSGQMLQRRSRYGKNFYACSAYPSCQYILNSLPISGRCEHCGFELLTVKKTQRGDKYVCANKRCAKAVNIEFKE